ncbi:MAG: nascent polypeptide-associated complex protein [Candidatus Verstraetearchaeota archaeon]|nr:nascent polypeptide-associated complex protein [Candidatus Verstraetearchaeota archaeon]
MSQREMKRIMQKMGMGLEELQGVLKVTIHFRDRRLVIPDPQVTQMKVSGQTIYQVVGEAFEEKEKTETKIEISEEDAQLVSAQTGATIEQAKKALEASNGDLAQAIMLLTSKA